MPNSPSFNQPPSGGIAPAIKKKGHNSMGSAESTSADVRSLDARSGVMTANVKVHAAGRAERERLACNRKLCVVSNQSLTTIRVRVELGQ